MENCGLCGHFDLEKGVYAEKKLIEQISFN